MTLPANPQNDSPKDNKPMEEVKLHNTMDAKIWTDEFMRLHPEGQQDLKWDDMIGWFANAIMVGYDHGRWKLEPELTRQSEEIKQLKELHAEVSGRNVTLHLNNLELERHIEDLKKQLHRWKERFCK